MRFLTRFLEFFLVRVSVDCPTLCRTFCSGGAQALCGTFIVLGGVWRRPMSEALPELCGTFRTGGAEFYAARALAPEPRGRREEPAALVSLESGSSWSDGRRACPPPKRAPRCDNPAISTNHGKNANCSKLENSQRI